jgi:hypothetical protein
VNRFTKRRFVVSDLKLSIVFVAFFFVVVVRCFELVVVVFAFKTCSTLTRKNRGSTIFVFGSEFQFFDVVSNDSVVSVAKSGRSKCIGPISDLL